jgi:hypothetical protein
MNREYLFIDRAEPTGITHYTYISLPIDVFPRKHVRFYRNCNTEGHIFNLRPSRESQHGHTQRGTGQPKNLEFMSTSGNNCTMFNASTTQKHNGAVLTPRETSQHTNWSLTDLSCGYRITQEIKNQSAGNSEVLDYPTFPTSLKFFGILNAILFVLILLLRNKIKGCHIQSSDQHGRPNLTVQKFFENEIFDEIKSRHRFEKLWEGPLKRSLPSSMIYWSAKSKL